MSKNPRCLYENNLYGFLYDNEKSILGALVENYNGQVQTTQIDAWKEEISIMRNVAQKLEGEDGRVVFEYDIPRLGKRVDVVLLYRGIIFCIEFKVGQTSILEADIDQVFDYALDLKNFHRFSEDKIIAPILVATNHESYSTQIQMSVYDDKVINPLISGSSGLYSIIESVLDVYPNEQPIDERWSISPYAPTPTIIEAARSLYENHSVEEITRHEADNVSTDRTINYILDVIHDSEEKGKKSICFVTGVPGAGKTLV